MNELNVLIENEFTERNKDLVAIFFDNEEFVTLPANATMVDIVMLVPNMFVSRGRAKGNGFDKPIENGFNEFTLGKKRFKIWCFKPL